MRGLYGCGNLPAASSDRSSFCSDRYGNDPNEPLRIRGEARYRARKSLLLIEASNAVQTTTTNSEGAYTLPLLPLAPADRGLDTLIGEGGVKVSGGKRSAFRSLARCFASHACSSSTKRPPRWIPSRKRSHAPSATWGRRADVITILIAQRLSTVMHAERIYVLERGSIVEQGTHHELLLHTGLYLRVAAATNWGRNPTNPLASHKTDPRHRSTWWTKSSQL